MDATHSTNSVTNEERSPKSSPRQRAVRASVERFVEKAWVPLESFALSAVSKLSLHPRLAVDQSEDAIEVAVEVPGIEAGELEVAIDGSTLRIHGARSEQHEKRGPNYYKMERYRTSFDRSVRLRSPVESEKASATLKNGVLSIRMPIVKAGNGSARRVPVPNRAA